ncbi:MAG: hypothetical protein GWO22_34055, partial [Actinobacteria bacterium]|nr:hypothetical protein [Actinomycetota bacterium]NIT98281.1 hypothetical protein [Actinomycetota bacterium]NIX53258.1 hypothetical protein [Actinomycetota bacterium]
MRNQAGIVAILTVVAVVAATCSGGDGTATPASTSPPAEPPGDGGDAGGDTDDGDVAEPDGGTPEEEFETVPGFVDEAAFRARQADYLAHATEQLDPSSALNVLAHVTRAKREGTRLDLSSVTPESLAGPLDDIRGWRDTSDFDALYLLNLLHAGDEVLPTATVDAITDALLGFEYWYTEPTPDDVVDDKYYWSENHRIIFHTVELLAGNRWPDETFRNDGRTGAEHAADARERILTWMEEKARFGFTEWHSDVYYQKDV